MPDAILTRFRGDNASLALTCLHPDTGATFNPTGHVLIFTIKAAKSDPDSAAIVQKISTIGGISIVDAGQGNVAVALVPADMDLLTADVVYFYDLQAQHATTGAVYTVASGRLAPTQDVTRSTTLSIPTTTTNPGVGYTWANIPDKPATFPALTGSTVEANLAGGATLNLTLAVGARVLPAEVTCSGTGVAIVVLGDLNAVDTALAVLRLIMPAGAGLKVEVRNSTAVGTLLAEVSTDGTAGVVGIVCARGATAWKEPNAAAWLD